MLLNNLFKTMATYSLVLAALLNTTAAHAQENIKDNTVAGEQVIYKEINGTQLRLNILTPDEMQEDTTYPTIIYFFGGGWNAGSIKQFADKAKYFASKGMITVLADYRVNKRHQTTPFDAVRDAKSAMRYLRLNAKKLQIDTNRIVAAGGSAGGHLAAATSIIGGLNEPNEDLTISTKANALILYNPVIDNSEAGYGYERIGERYKEISPMHNIKQGAPPTLFMLGSKDHLIPVSTGKEYQARMQAVGSRCDLIIYEGVGHGFFNVKKNDSKYHELTNQQSEQFLRSLGYIK